MEAAAGRRYLFPIPPSYIAPADDDELHEDEILWTDDYNPTQLQPPKSKQQPKPRKGGGGHRRSVSFQHPTSGILAALPEFNQLSALYRKPSAKAIPAQVPRPGAAERESDFLLTQSAPGKKMMQQSAPMKVPMLSAAMAKQRKSRFREEYGGEEVSNGEFDDEMMLPPHEIVARENWRQSSNSMLEGVGRTLKGRDLRQVRNAVFRQTGFLD